MRTHYHETVVRKGGTEGSGGEEGTGAFATRPLPSVNWNAEHRAAPMERKRPEHSGSKTPHQTVARFRHWETAPLSCSSKLLRSDAPRSCCLVAG
jgi:hypothetical protein